MLHQVLSSIQEDPSSATPDKLKEVMRLFKMRTEALKSPDRLLSTPHCIKLAMKMIGPEATAWSYSKIFHRLYLEVSSPEVFAEHLVPYRRAFSLLVKDLLSEYWDEESPLLELGSGGFPLAEVVGYLSDPVKMRILLSDVRRPVVLMLREKYPKYASDIRDLTSLSRVESPGSLGVVVMTSVLDTLDIDQLKLGFEQIYKCLKPGGVLIHFAPRTTFPSATNHEYSNPDDVVFPIISGGKFKQWSGVYVVKKEELIKKIKELNPAKDKVLIDLLNHYISLPPALREDYLSNPVIEGSVMIHVTLQEALEQLNCDGVKTIDFWDAFNQRLVSCAEMVQEAFNCRVFVMRKPN